MLWLSNLLDTLHTGALSQVCYYKALEDVYERLVSNIQKSNGEQTATDTTSSTDRLFNAETPDYWVFHAPYNKLVQKSYGRLLLMDARRRRMMNQLVNNGFLDQSLNFSTNIFFDQTDIFHRRINSI